MLTIIIILFVIILMVLANALYVAAEFATVSARRTRISQMAGSGHQLAKQLLPIMEDRKALDDYVATCQIGITVSSLVLGAYGQGTVAEALAPVLVNLGNLAEPIAFSISTTGVLIFLTIFQVVLGELFPKSVAIQYPEALALGVVIPMKWSLIIFRPLIWLFNGSSNFLLKLLGTRRVEEHAHAYSPAEIELLVTESHEGGLLDAEEQQMLRNAFRLRELTARQVMVPRTRLVAAPVESSVSYLLDLICREGYTRIPLYQGKIDNIVGFVHLKDLFQRHVQGQQSIQDIVREVIYVPESLAAADVWEALNKNHQYIAIVFDEYGGTAGLITFEDLIEEVFGELQDEFDADELPLLSSEKDGRLRLRADLLVADVNEYLGLDLPHEDVDTLGGLVFSELGRVPAVGDEVAVGTPEVTIRVETMEALGIAEVSLQLPVDTPPHIEEWTGGEMI
ncbi:MAG: HlyC/CorC family transporter [Anaerolineae bacterium]|nr:HlyC/CorC family transporter [Anaerolineales bacterium]MCQ3975776.1 HlyC/CorC family transporter [Anaerolineae bacterium]